MKHQFHKAWCAKPATPLRPTLIGGSLRRGGAGDLVYWGYAIGFV